MSARRLQGLVLLAGAAATWLLLDSADIGFHWTPFVLGVVYLVAALLGGPGGSYWSTAVVLTVFGLGPVARFEYEVDLSAASIYVVALGVAVLLAGRMAERGFAITQTAVGATIVALGVVFALQTELDVITEPGLYAGFLAAVGLLRVVRS
ncbi:MAG: hypothetical protein JWO90_3177 [Solirubrobacterales bacterium]|nr:hypothetical protein [Solirubrobacterales bacterium]